MNLNNEDLKFLKDLSNKMVSQDRRCTADPYYYVVRTEKEVPTRNGCGERTIFLDFENDYMEFDSKEDAKKYYIENDYEEDEIEKAINKLDECDVKTEYEYNGFFLTEEDCENHIKLNHYHYCKPVSYIMHAWRTREVETLFNIIKKFATNDQEEL